MRSLDHIVRGFAATLVARAAYMLSSALLMVLLARVFLDPDAYGLLFWSIGVLAVVQLAADLGLGKSAARYIAEYGETDPGQIPHLLRHVIGYKLVVVSIVGGLLFVGAGPLAAALGKPAAEPFFAVGALLVVAKSFAVFPEIVFQGSNRLGYSATVRAIGGVGRLVFAVAFVLAGFGAIGALFGYVVGYVIAAAFGVTAMYVLVYGAHESATEMADGLSRRLVAYSVPLTATRGANVLDKQIDIVLVGVFLNSTAVAFYTLAKQLTDFVLAPAESLGFVISPNFGEGKAGGDVARARTLYETALRNALALYVPAAVGLALVAEPLVTLVFGASYAGAAPVLTLLSGFVVLQTITNLTSDGLDYLGRARERAIAKGATSIGNFALNVALIPALGVVGAALATVVTHSIYVAVTLYVVHDELSLHLRRLAMDAARTVAISGVMAGTIVFVAPPITTLPLLGVTIGLGVISWVILALASGVIEVRSIRAVLG